MKIKAECEGGCGTTADMQLQDGKPSTWYGIFVEGPNPAPPPARIAIANHTFCPVCYAKIAFPAPLVLPVPVKVP